MKKVIGILLLGTALFDAACLVVNDPKLWIIFDIDVLIVCGGLGIFLLVRKAP